MAIEHEEARIMVWAQERNAAFEAANLEAHLQFNLCENCGRWVCENCYDTRDGYVFMCRECESREKGKVRREQGEVRNEKIKQSQPCPYTPVLR
jgi:hypothetical protein